MLFQVAIIGMEIQIRRKELRELVKNNDLTSDVVLEKSRQLDDLVIRHYEVSKNLKERLFKIN